MATIVWEELKQEGIGWVARRNVYRMQSPRRLAGAGSRLRIPTLSLFFRTLSTGGCKCCRVRSTHQLISAQACGQ